MMRICFFGDHDPLNPRVATVLKGLSRLEVTVLHVNVRRGGPFRYLGLWRGLARIKGEYDFVVVPESASLLMPLLAAVCTETPVAWLVGNSRYDLAANDHSKPVHNLGTFFLWLMDWWMAGAADVIVLPSRAYAEYFAAKFGVPSQKVLWTYIGADDEQFHPPEVKENEVFEVVYSGPFTPSVGAEVLVRAAKLLEGAPGLHFTIIGEGVDQKEIQSLIAELACTNVVYLPFAAPGEVERRFAEASVIIGILGETPLVSRLLPGRVWNGAASGRALVTALSPAIAEAFTVGEQIVLVKPGDVLDVAEKLQALKEDPSRVRELGLAAYQRYSAIGTPEAVARRLVEALESVRK
jgi:glycosyltransferase involved in cell wall biosynthesis